MLYELTDDQVTLIKHCAEWCTVMMDSSVLKALDQPVLAYVNLAAYEEAFERGRYDGRMRDR
jgi:hypothetical protein